MIDYGSAKYDHPFHAAKVSYFQKRIRDLKDEKRLRPKSKNQRARRMNWSTKEKEENPKEILEKW